ncbi:MULTISPECIES: hypothetical protein [Variovorax]|jgi:hypothetical protein|uniref:Uncharacterized protein n=1 Tax=Variovorax paradoxus TaxID=34073 RepID=A0AA91DSS9_VARPD|nr:MULTISPECIES: hypothetical protein [Variovorax]OAK65836.1 hypothetical protein A3K87_00755 [Variovorax paradoxus]QRY34282.1 hypothetical protein JVX96_13695 [Variovorax sp. PDNC026]
MATPEEATTTASAANLLGTEMALTAALRALIKTHPQPSLLAQELVQQRQFSQAHLEASPVSDKALMGFELTWAMILHQDPAQDVQLVPAS